MAETGTGKGRSGWQASAGGITALLIALGFLAVVGIDLGWLAAMDVLDAAARYHLATPPGATAVIWSHGHYSVWPFGTIGQNPWGFVLFNIGAIAVLALLNYLGKSSPQAALKP